MPGDAPPHIIEIDAVGAIAVLLENLSLKPYSAASGQGPFSSARTLDALSTFSWIFLNILLFCVDFLKTCLLSNVHHYFVTKLEVPHQEK